MATFDLTTLGTNAATDVKASEDVLATALTTIGTSSSASDLLKVQVALNQNSVITAIYSGIIKERSDTMKGIAQKF